MKESTLSKSQKGKSEKLKFSKQNIFLSRDKTAAAVARTKNAKEAAYLGFVLNQKRRLHTWASFNGKN